MGKCPNGHYKASKWENVQMGKRNMKGKNKKKTFNHGASLRVLAALIAGATGMYNTFT